MPTAFYLQTGRQKMLIRLQLGQLVSWHAGMTKKCSTTNWCPGFMDTPEDNGKPQCPTTSTLMHPAAHAVNE